MNEGVKTDPAPASTPDPVSLPAGFNERIMLSRDLARLIELGEQNAKDMNYLRERHVLLQGQMTVMERMLSNMGTLLLRVGTTSVPPEALAVASKDAQEAMEKIAKQQQEEEDAMIEKRGGDHPPTPAELEAAEAENLR